MDKPDDISFVYSLQVREIPHTQDTVKWALGTDYYNPDFGIDIHAREILNQLFLDAITHRLRVQLLSLKNTCEDEALLAEAMERSEKLIEIYRQIQNSLKLEKTCG